MSATPSFQPFLPSTLPVKKIIASGTNLFRIAANELGDATQWYRIAEMNLDKVTNPETGQLDPWIGPATELLIPPAGPSNGGILQT